MSASLTLVIPTRNRAQLAIAAVDGLLAEAGDRMRLLVSDNSTDEEQARALAGFCEARSDPRLTYLRAAAAMPQPAHWDWALEQALAREETSHFTIHYDRKVPKLGQWRFMLDEIDAHAAQVITYPIDQVLREPPRFTVWQIPWSGKTYEVRTARVLQMASEGSISEMGHAFPILSNCAVPRAVIDKVRRRFGDICNSTGPDAAFTFRFCALEDSYLHLDRPLGVVYAVHRSAGLGYWSGAKTDFEDFRRSHGDRAWLDAVPLPQLDLIWNMLFHEYEMVRREVGDRLPELTLSAYLDGLAWGLPLVEDPARRQAMEDVLIANGWQRPEEREEQAPVAPTSSGGLRSRVGRVVRRHRQLVRLAAAVGAIPEPNGLTFPTEEEAVQFARTGVRRRSSENPLLEPLLEAGARRGGDTLRTRNGT